MDGTIEGITTEIIAIMRIDKEYVKNKVINIKKLIPEVWDTIYPFEEKGMYKKHFTVNYKYPKDSEYN